MWEYKSKCEELVMDTNWQNYTTIILNFLTHLGLYNTHELQASVCMFILECDVEKNDLKGRGGGEGRTQLWIFPTSYLSINILTHIPGNK